MTQPTPLHPEFERRAWFAFDEVLGWINTQDVKHIDKHDLYRFVFELRPASLMSKSLEGRETHG